MDRSIRHVRQPVGNIRRLTAAVVVNYRRAAGADGKPGAPQALPEATMTQINALVKQAMGFTESRQDALNVTNAAFTVETPEVIPELPLWQQPEMLALAREIGKNVGLGLLFLYLLFGIIRPLFKRVGAAADALGAEQQQIGRAHV